MRLLTKMSLGALVALGMFSCSDDAEIKNLAPTNPAISSPANDSKEIDVDVVLKWNASTDPEKGIVKYDVYLGATKILTDKDIKSKDQTTLEYTEKLSGHTLYFWKVVAKDVAGGLTASKVYSFVTANGLPTAVANLIPINEATILNKKVTFTWDPSVDSDKDAVKYNLYVSEKKDFVEADIKQPLMTDCTVELTLEVGKTYFWQVETIDAEGGKIKSVVNTFTTANNLPTAVVNLSPKNAATILSKKVTFKWDPSVDADKDAVKYNLYVSEKKIFVEADIKQALMTDCTVELALEVGKTYFWQVETIDAEGGKIKSVVSTFTTANNLPTVVGSLFPANEAINVNKTLTFTWAVSVDADKDILKYNLYVSKNNTFTAADIKAKETVKNAIELSLEAHTKYFWQVETIDAEGGKVKSSVVSFTTANSLPTVALGSLPADMAIDVTKTPILKWSASTDADGDAVKYNVYLSKSNVFKAADVIAPLIGECTFTIAKELDVHTTYYWQVETIGSEGEKVKSTICSFRTFNTAPTAPIYSTPTADAVNVAKTATTFTWKASTDADNDVVKYNLYLSRKNTISDMDLQKEDIAATTFTLPTELMAHTKYYWRIAAVDSEGKMTRGEVFSFRTQNTLPTKPVLVDFIDSKVNNLLNVSITWNASTDADSDAITYDVYVTKNNDFADADKVATDLSVTNTILAGLDFGADYKFKIVAKDAFGALVDSEIKTFNYDAAAYKISVDHFNITKPAVGFEGGLCLLEWETAGNDVKYDVVISANADFSTPLVQKENVLGLNTNVSIQGATENSRLYVKVVAKDEAGKSLKSNEYSFTYKKFGTFTDTRDNKIYKTVNIDGKIWLAENLAFLPAEDTNPEVVVPGIIEHIGSGDDAKTIDPAKLAYADIKNHKNYGKYGLLYSRKEIARVGVVPAGWHIPTPEEWDVVEKSVGMTDEEILSSEYVGTGAINLKSNEAWTNKGTNESGLNFLPSGYGILSGGWMAPKLEVNDFGISTAFWTSNYTPGRFAKEYIRALVDTDNGVKNGRSMGTRRYSVRLVKD
jgi:uncharacterized protein (TIGR02145 family)